MKPKPELSTEIQKRIADLYAEGKSYRIITDLIQTAYHQTIDHNQIKTIRNRFKLKPRHNHIKVRLALNPTTSKPAKPLPEVDDLVQAFIRKLRLLDRPPLAILVEPKDGSYRIQTSVEYEGKVK